MKTVDESKINAEDIRWLNVVRRTVDGLAAMAEAQAEGCTLEWMAMEYGLESVRDIVDSILQDYRNRKGDK